MATRYDIATIKQAAAGRWPEILTRLGGIAPELLDGRHHPCPKDGGVDRFRALDDFAETGAVLCNQCFASGNGDGLAALQWLCGWDFSQALREVAKFLGGMAPATNGNGQGRRTGKASLPPILAVDWCNELEPKLREQALQTWCAAKRGTTAEAAQAFRVRYGRWPKRERTFGCLAFAGRSLEDSPTTKAVLLYRADAQEFPAVGKLGTRKTHLVGGSIESWIWPGAVEDLAAADTIVKVEGVTDALALHSLELPPGWLVLTNACGAKSANPKKLDFAFAKGKRVVVVGDADKPGQDGARKFAAAFHAAGARELRLVQLFEEIAPDHGRDLRDWILQ